MAEDTLDDNILMDGILTKLHLNRHIIRFHDEKITPDIVCKLSLYDMKCLGVSDRNEVMKLRIECNHYGNIQPPREACCGPPQFRISRTTLETLIEMGFMIQEIACLLSVSESTIYRRMRTFGLRKLQFTDIDDNLLVDVVTGVVEEFPRCGEKMLREILRHKNIHVSMHLYVCT